METENEALRREIAKLQSALVNLLRARYTDGGEPYAIHQACIVSSHPDKYPEGRKPPYKPNGCPCGERKEPLVETADAG